jgi:hypothetical protein
MQAAFQSYRDKLINAIHNAHTETDVRRLCMVQIGSNMAWYRLIDRTTGKDMPMEHLRASLADYAGSAEDSKGILSRLSALFTRRTAAPAPPMYHEYFAAFYREQMQKSNDIVKELVSPEQLGRFRLSVIRHHEEGILSKKFGYLLFYDTDGVARTNKQAFRAAQLALLATVV